MDSLNLKLSTSQNRALNQDGVTLLRSLSLNQGETYQVNLAFLDGSTPVVPSIGAFSFFLRNTAGLNLLSVDSVTSQAGDYPYYFTFSASSPALSTALGSSAYADLTAVISYDDSGTLETLAPFTVRVFSTQSTATADYLSTLNGLTSDATIAGGGSVSVSTSGETITVSGSVPDLSPYALQSTLSATGTGLQAQITALQGQSANYYLNSNPSGFITGLNLSPYATAANLGTTGSTLQNQITTLNGQSGSWYPRTNPSGYLSAIPSDVVRTTGTQTISGLKTFANEAFFPSGASGVYYGDGSRLTGIAGGATNAVLLTGNQTVSGAKTFYNTIVANTNILIGGLNVGAGSDSWLTVNGNHLGPPNYISKTDRTDRLAGATYQNGDVVVEGGLPQITQIVCDAVDPGIYQVTQIVCNSVAGNAAAVLTMDFSSFAGNSISFYVDGAGISTGDSDPGTIPDGFSIPGWNATISGTTITFTYPTLGSGHTFGDPNTLSDYGITYTFTDGSISADAGHYFTVSMPNAGPTFTLWLQIDGQGTAPGVNPQEYPVIINGAYDFATVSAAIQAAIIAMQTIYGLTLNVFTNYSNTVTLTAQNSGPATNSADGNTGFNVFTSTGGVVSADSGHYFTFYDRTGNSYSVYLAPFVGTPPGVSTYEQQAYIGSGFGNTDVASAITATINSAWPSTFVAVQSGGTVTITTVFNAPTTEAADVNTGFAVSTNQAGEAVAPNANHFLLVDVTQKFIDAGWVELVTITDDTGWTANADSGNKNAVIPDRNSVSAMQTALNNLVAGFGDAFLALTDKVKAQEAALSNNLLPNA